MRKNEVKVFGPSGVDLEMENKDLFRENARLISKLTKIQASVDQLVEDILSIRRGN